MNLISASTIVACPHDQADRRLAEYVERLGGGSGEPAQLELTANLPHRASEPQPGFESVTATLRAVHEACGASSYAVSWSPKGTQTYPAFVGSLWAAASDDDDSFELVLDGRYEPPGSARTAAERSRAERVAAAIAEHLMAAVGRSLEAALLGEDAAARGAFAAAVLHVHAKRRIAAPPLSALDRA